MDNLTRHAGEHKAPFPIVADENNKYYREYGIEHSVFGMFKGYIPTTINGSMTTMPADFLIDRDGMIQVAYYGRDEGDHLPFDSVREFSLK